MAHNRGQHSPNLAWKETKLFVSHLCLVPVCQVAILVRALNPPDAVGAVVEDPTSSFKVSILSKSITKIGPIINITIAQVDNELWNSDIQ